MIFFSMKVYATKMPLIQVIVSQFAPYEYVDDKGKETGFSLEVFQAIAEEVGAEIEVAFYPWSRGMKILAKNPNAVIFTATRNETREDNFKWVGPIASRSVNIYKLKESRFTLEISSLNNEEALSDILSKQYVIGAAIGDASEISLKAQGYDVFSVPHTEQYIQMLFKNRLGLISGLELTLAYRLNKLGYKFSDVEKVAVFNDKYSYYFMFNKRISSDVVYQFQKALGKIKYNGVYAKLKEKYLN